ncbi:four helix bundle protein [Spirosoma sp. SC4-14]|uniref:four helix bundle protein n=1 Tax=Spirosoma sp. SC4-14 TaxID=3128900 RepID=UPI0030D43715
MSIQIGDKLFDIAEGSATTTPNEFRQFLNYARRSCYECANILVVIQRRNQITEGVKQDLFNELANLSRKIYNFQQTIH